jgi:hypothetical protein
MLYRFFFNITEDGMNIRDMVADRELVEHLLEAIRRRAATIHAVSVQTTPYRFDADTADQINDAVGQIEMLTASALALSDKLNKLSGIGDCPLLAEKPVWREHVTRVDLSGVFQPAVPDIAADDGSPMSGFSDAIRHILEALANRAAQANTAAPASAETEPQADAAAGSPVVPGDEAAKL